LVVIQVVNSQSNDELVRHFWIDTDIGGDIDDVLALMVFLRMKTKNNKLHGISTVHVDPTKKAKIAKLIASEYGHRDIPVFAGEGWTPGESEQKFFSLYPFWPKIAFGVPSPKENQKPLYSLQGKAYADKFDNLSKLKVEQNREILFQTITKTALTMDTKLNIICLGPLTNIAELLRKSPAIKSQVRLWIMGGWFEESGKIKRPGYNTGVNLKDAQEVFNSKVEIILINANFIEKHKFTVDKEAFELFMKTEAKTVIGKCIKQDWINWNKGDFFNKKNIADPLTVLLALRPKYVTKFKNIQMVFKPDQNNPIAGNNVHFLDESASKLLEVKYVTKSNIKLVDQLLTGKEQDYTKLNNDILNVIFDSINN
jgi:inosine-uridine nucleoside N-ribohydrolase